MQIRSKRRWTKVLTQQHYKTSWYKPQRERDNCCSSWTRWKMMSIGSRRSISTCRRISMTSSGALRISGNRRRSILNVGSGIRHCIVQYLTLPYLRGERFLGRPVLRPFQYWANAHPRLDSRESNFPQSATRGRADAPSRLQSALPQVHCNLHKFYGFNLFYYRVQ